MEINALLQLNVESNIQSHLNCEVSRPTLKLNMP